MIAWDGKEASAHVDIGVDADRNPCANAFSNTSRDCKSDCDSHANRELARSSKSDRNARAPGDFKKTDPPRPSMVSALVSGEALA